jgi:hypothetical protein
MGWSCRIERRRAESNGRSRRRRRREPGEPSSRSPVTDSLDRECAVSSIPAVSSSGGGAAAWVGDAGVSAAGVGRACSRCFCFDGIARIAAVAGPSEIVVSRTVTDLVMASGIQFEDRGQHELKGVPGTWRL